MKINGKEFLFGADPEFFVAKGGHAVSAHGLVGGTKDEPLAVKNGAVQVDGMALEFNINPAKTFEEFSNNIDSVLSQILAMVPGYEPLVDTNIDYSSAALGPKYLLKSVADFDPAYLAAQPKEARELGCNPDYNAYTKEVNPRPNAETPFRTTSGHLHIGWTKDVDPLDKGHFNACVRLTKALDAYLGIPSMVWDKEDRRRELYGRAGAFRPKSYGMEYRVLSNKWINSPVLRKLVFHNAVEAIKACFERPETFDNLKYSSLTVPDIMDKKAGFESACVRAMTVGGIKSAKDYK